MNRLDDDIKSVYRKIPYNVKVAFFSSLIIGLIAHLYMFTNKFPNYDDMALNGFGATFRLGRWFLWVLGSVAYHLDLVYSIPLINGMVSLLLLAISSSIIVYLLDVKSNIAVVIISGILVVFPSWTATYFFMFTAPYYAVAVLLMVLSVYFSWNYKYGFILGICCIALSVGIYQAYLPFGASLYVILLLKKLINNDVEWKKVFRLAVKSLCVLIAGVVVYYIIMRLSLIVTNQELADYKGTGQMGQVSMSLIPQILQSIFTDGLGVIVNNNIEISYNLLLKVGYMALFLVDIILFGVCCKRYVTNKEFGRMLMFVLLIVAVFVAINGIFIMCPTEGAVYSLMTYAYAFYIILPVCMIEWLLSVRENRSENLIIAVEYGVVITSVAMIFNYCHFSNSQYLSMQLTYEQAKGFYTTLITQIKSVDGYTDDMPIAIIEDEAKIEDKTLYRNQVMDVFDISGRDDVLVETYSREYLLAYYCGFDPEYVADDFISEDIVKSMPNYPKEGSIQVIDGVVVVKLN